MTTTRGDVPGTRRPGTRRLCAAPAAGELSAAERLSRDELQSRQLERLRWTLRHAYDHVPFYRRRFDAAGVHPGDFRELADLRKFPTTTKHDLRDNYPFGMFAVHGVPRRDIRTIPRSSTRPAGTCCPTARRGNWCSPR